jgi:hypothetical protein
VKITKNIIKKFITFNLVKAVVKTIFIAAGILASPTYGMSGKYKLY